MKLLYRSPRMMMLECESSINRDDVYMMIQCDKCAKCRTCKDIRKINASSYNDFVEQQAMEQLMKFVEGKNGEPGYFNSPLPLKPFNINSVKGNRATADEQNKRGGGVMLYIRDTISATEIKK